MSSLSLAQAGGEQVRLANITLVPPIKITVAGLPAASGVANQPGQGILLGTTLVFTSPRVPLGLSSGSINLTDANGTTQSVSVSFVPSRYGSFTFALRSLFDATWKMGPRNMAQVPSLVPPDPSAIVVPGSPGVWEWLTAAIGDVLTGLGGIWLTRLSQDAAIGDSQLYLERSAGLPAQGQVRLDGIVYAYTGISGNALTGITATAGQQVVTGVQAVHAAGVQVADASGTSSYLDLLRASYFVETASGDDLAQLGRDLGVAQSPAVGSDTQLRAIIKAIAFAPKGTIYALETALDALLGPGTYTLTEDPYNAPCTVFVNVPYNQLSSGTSPGHAYLNTTQTGAPASGSFLLPAYATGSGRIMLNDENQAFSCNKTLLTSIPDSDGNTFWYSSGGGIGTSSMGNDGSVATTLAGITGKLASARTVRLSPASSGHFSAWLRVGNGAQVNATSGLGCALRVTGSVSYVAGMTGTTGGVLVAQRNPTTGAAVGPTAFIPDGTWTRVSIVYTPAGWTLFVNFTAVSYLAAPSVAGSTVAASVTIGQVGASNVTHGSSAYLQLRQVDLICRDPTDYGCGQAAVAQTSGNSISSASYAMGAEAVGHQVWITGSSATNSQGGTNDGTYSVSSVAGANVYLQGPAYSGCSATLASGISTVSLPTGANPLWFPRDLGKKVVITGSRAGNNGTYIIADMLDDLTGASLSAGLTRLPQRSRTVRLTTNVQASEGFLGVQVMPALVADSTMQMLTDSGTLVTTSSTQVRVTPRSLPRSDVTYILPFGACSSASILPSASSTVSVQAGPPVVPSQYGLYLSSPFGILDAYSSDLTAAGVALVLNTS